MTPSRAFFCTIVALSLCCALNAQPKLLVQSEMDWGTIVPSGPANEQQRVRAKLALKNTGDATLLIREVRPSCGCVTAPLERDSIAPDAEVFIDIAMNFPVANGPLSKTLTIHTNEPADSLHVVVLKADLVRPIQLSSSFVPFNKGIVGDAVEGEFTVTSFAPVDVVVTVAMLTKGVVATTQSPFVLAKGKPETIRLRYVPLAAGSYRVDFELQTSLSGYEVIPMSGFGVTESRPAR